MGTLNVNTTDNQINITPTDTQIRVFAGGYAQPGGNDTEIQYNDGGVLAGAANITYTNGNMVISNNNFKITGGTNGYFLQTDGTGNLTWYPGTAFPTGNGTVGGANGQIQFNNAGNFGGLAGFTANVINNNISMPNNLSVGSNINVARITATGNITANYFIGNGAFLTGIDASKIQNGNSNVSVAANSNVTISVAGNANVVTITNNSLVANGNVSANYFIGNGSQLTGIDTTQIQNGNSNVRVFANSDVTVSIGGFANILKIEQANSRIFTVYEINVGGAVTAVQYFGSGQNLSNITAANVIGVVANANYAANAGNALVANSANSVAGANVTGQVANALVAGTVYTANQPNITSVGTLSSLTVAGTANISNISPQFLNITSNGAINFQSNLNVRINAPNYANTAYMQTLINFSNAGANWYSIGIGNPINADNLGNSSISIGYQARAPQANSVTIGRSSISSLESVTLGALSGAGTYGVTLGARSNGSNGAITIGYQANGGGLSSIAIGLQSGASTGETSIAIGAQAGQKTSNNTIAIGSVAGIPNVVNAIAQGANSIAIGHRAGYNFPVENSRIHENSIILNATGQNFVTAQANSLFVKPIRDVTGESGFVELVYNPTTGEIGYRTA